MTPAYIFDIVWSYDLSFLVNGSFGNDDNVQTLAKFALLYANTICISKSEILPVNYQYMTTSSACLGGAVGSVTVRAAWLR